MATTVIALVIDDDAQVRELLRDFLEDKRHRVYDAGEGDAGIQLLKEHPEIEIVFLDIKMPGKDGIQVLAELRAIKPSIKVVMITAYPDDAYVEATMAQKAEVQADGFIAKPFSIDSLDACIKMIFEKKMKYLGSTATLDKMAREYADED